MPRKFEIKWWWDESDEERAKNDPEYAKALEDAGEKIEDLKEQHVSKDEIIQKKDEIVEEVIAEERRRSRENIVDNKKGEPETKVQEEGKQKTDNNEEGFFDSYFGSRDKTSEEQKKKEEEPGEQKETSYNKKDQDKDKKTEDKSKWSVWGEDADKKEEEAKLKKDQESARREPETLTKDNAAKSTTADHEKKQEESKGWWDGWGNGESATEGKNERDKMAKQDYKDLDTNERESKLKDSDVYRKQDEARPYDNKAEPDKIKKEKDQRTNGAPQRKAESGKESKEGKERNDEFTKSQQDEKNEKEFDKKEDQTRKTAGETKGRNGEDINVKGGIAEMTRKKEDKEKMDDENGRQTAEKKSEEIKSKEARKDEERKVRDKTGNEAAGDKEKTGKIEDKYEKTKDKASDEKDKVMAGATKTGDRSKAEKEAEDKATRDKERTDQSKKDGKKDSASEDKAKKYRNVALYCGIFNILIILLFLLYTEILTDGTVTFNKFALFFFVIAFVPFIVFAFPGNMTTVILSYCSSIVVIFILIYLFMKRVRIEYYIVELEEVPGFTSRELLALDMLEYTDKTVNLLNKLSLAGIDLHERLKRSTKSGVNIFILTHTITGQDTGFVYDDVKAKNNILNAQLPTESKLFLPAVSMRFSWSRLESIVVLKAISRTYFTKLGQNYSYIIGVFPPDVDFQKYFGSVPKSFRAF